MQTILNYAIRDSIDTATCFVWPNFNVNEEVFEKLVSIIKTTNIGGIYGDWVENGIRVFSEPFDRKRLELHAFEPPLIVVNNKFIDKIEPIKDDMKPLWIYEYMLRLTEICPIYHYPAITCEGTREEIDYEKEIRRLNGQ